MTVADPTLSFGVEAPRPELLGGGVDVAGRHPQAQPAFDALRRLLRCLLRRLGRWFGRPPHRAPDIVAVTGPSSDGAAAPFR